MGMSFAVTRRVRCLRAAAGPVLALSLSLAAGCSSGPAPGSDVAVPGCSTRVTVGKILASVAVTKVPVPGTPDEVVGAQDGRWAFASVLAVTGPEITVLALRHGSPTLVRTIALPGQRVYA